MSKRSGHLNGIGSDNIKKPKIDTTLDDLWGDELDAKDVDDCLLLATQMCQNEIKYTQINNVSILPSYSAFRETSKQLFSSTQYKQPNIVVNGVANPSNDSGAKSSNFKRAQSFDNTNGDNLETKVKRLEEQIEAKSGEVTILRSKLQNIKDHHDAEQNKMHKDWDEKLQNKIKELKETETRLMFKNLEIHQLNKKLKDVINLSQSNGRSPFFKQSNVVVTAETADPKEDVVKRDFKIRQLPEQTYPLKDVVYNQIFADSIEEMFLKDVNHKVTCISMQSECKENNFTHSVLKLAALNTHEIDFIENQQHINNLLLLSEQLVQNLYRFLEELKAGTILDNTCLIDLKEINSESSALTKNQMGLFAKESIACLLNVLPHSSYLKQNLLLHHDCTYLSLILSVLKLVNELKLSFNFSHFLTTVINFLDAIVQLHISENLTLNHFVCEITKELIVAATSKTLFRYFLKFLNTATLQENFLSSLCKNVNVIEQQLAPREDIVYYTQSTCVLQILFILLKEYLKSDCLIANSSALKFMSNSIKSNPTWLFYQDDKCPCLSKIVNLYIRVMYKTLQLFNKLENNDDINLHGQVLISGIDTLYTLNFNLYYLGAKYVATYSQYKAVVKLLLNMKDVLKLRESKVEVLENLNKNDEVINLQEDAFKDTNLWGGIQF